MAEKKSRWDMAPSDAAVRAARAAALLNAKLAAEGQLAPPAPSIVKQAPVAEIVSTGDKFTLNIEINDSPNRMTLTRKSFMDDVTRRTGASLTTKGKYFAPGEPRDALAKPLHLFLQGPTREAVAEAAAIVNSEAGLSDTKGDSSSSSAPPDPLVAIERVFVNLETIPSFDIRAEVTGPGGSFLKHIATETEARVWLRGQGSGCHEPGTTKEAPEPLHIAIQHSQQLVVDRARGLCNSLLLTVRQKHELARASYQSSLYAYGIGAPPPSIYGVAASSYQKAFVPAYPPLPPGPPPVLQPLPAPAMVSEPEPRKRKFVEKEPEPRVSPRTAAHPAPHAPPPLPPQPARPSTVRAAGPLVAYGDDDEGSD
eukprot:m.36283 g.36283  ORF g.36283 m.36283 type:complete len:368 (+) comp9664_c1_seq1:40-1143(+)